MVDAIVGRIERALNKLDKSGGGDEGGVAPSVAAHAEFVKAAVQPFINAANKFPELKSVADWAKSVFDFEAVVIEATTVAAKPDDAKFAKFFAPVTKIIEASGNPAKNAFFNHIKAFNELIQAAQWVGGPGPKEFIKSQFESSQLFSNRILTTAKDLPDPEKTNHREYANGLKTLATKWGEYTDDFFKSGLIWKFGGVDIDSFKPGQKPASGDSKVTTESRLEVIAARLEKLASKGETKEGGKHPAVAAYEEFLAANLTPFLQACGHFPELKKVADFTKTAFEYQGKLITATTVSAKPSDGDLAKFVDPIAKVIEGSGKTDTGAFLNHQKAFNEAVQGLGWVLAPGPKAAITSQVEAADLYLNKVLVVAKDKADPEKTNHREYVKNLKGLFKALADYADEYFKMGLTWKAGGAPLSAFKV